MYQVINTKNKKPVRDAISCKPRTFETHESAQHLADSMTRDSRLYGTAWNSVRPTKYTVVSA